MKVYLIPRCEEEGRWHGVGWGGVQVCEVRFDSQWCGRRGGGWRGMGGGCAWRYVKVDLIPRDVEEGGWGGCTGM